MVRADRSPNSLLLLRSWLSQVVAAIVLVCFGIAVSTVSDFQMVSTAPGGTNSLGWLVGAGAVGATAAYQIWAGTKQTELQASSFQLLQQYCPSAAALLALLVPLMEPLGLQDPGPDTLMGYAACASLRTAQRKSSWCTLRVGAVGS